MIKQIGMQFFLFRYVAPRKDAGRGMSSATLRRRPFGITIVESASFVSNPSRNKGFCPLNGADFIFSEMT